MYGSAFYGVSIFFNPKVYEWGGRVQSPSITSFADHLCYSCLVFVMLSRLFIAALWSPAGKGLIS